MKNLVRLYLLTLSVSLSGLLWAQEQSAPASATGPVMRHTPDARHQTRQLTKRLGLTADQAAQAEPIFADRDEKLQSLSANTSLDAKSMHRQRRAIVADTDQRLAAVLTDPQRAQYAQWKTSRKAHHTPEASPQAPPAAV